MHRYIPYRDVDTPLSDKIRLKARPLSLPSPPPGTVVPVIPIGLSSVLHLSQRETPPEDARTVRRVFTHFFGPRPREEENQSQHEGRLADALEINQTAKILQIGHPSSGTPSRLRATLKVEEAANLPSAPYRVLQAPELEDDYYRSPLAYSPTCQCLAVALGSTVYRWSEWYDPKPVYRAPLQRRNGLTSLSFSSKQGGKAILAFGRKDGFFGLLPSQNPFNSGVLVPTEDLLVGDSQGTILQYVVEWPSLWEVSRDTWLGKVTPIAKIAAHTSQICALVWSPNGQSFMSGSNDNTVRHFEIDRMTESRFTERSATLARRGHNSVQGDNKAERDPPPPEDLGPSRREGRVSEGTSSHTLPGGEMAEADVAGSIPRAVHTPGQDVRVFGHGMETHCWRHDAAIKAIAFCPWQDGLVATGGGLGDKCIRFFHIGTNTPLATIVVGAQVTALIWSTTKREIAATFGYSHGYAQTEHPYRIVVFSWPSCRNVSAVAWPGGPRALCAIPYPRGPANAHERSRTAKEGTIVVASSDETLKFHEVWRDRPKSAIGGVVGILGSDVLEGLVGIDKEGDVIR
ncbi:Putative WD40/YVTN repeat-like-containing domain superfamily [Colletotrichum destructivum]|uniref:WD40/YVTN repeat-like-containing domain superfamily n=1 Tax=Colletotrichum destructivum TaxID=34406 RepID=A0AAX4ID04_9PEZI|nr:Putative WD40/YVTN repeat-like-containing domain superfamily [Colletotrichum destructivum]